MGGVIGMLLAGSGTPIKNLVLNDIGPFFPFVGIERLLQYVGREPHFESLEKVEAYLRRIMAPFGNLTDDQWSTLAKHSGVDDGQGPAFDSCRTCDSD